MIGALGTCQENLTSASGNDTREAHLVGAKTKFQKERLKNSSEEALY
jgi:hypothetical protein